MMSQSLMSERERFCKSERELRKERETSHGFFDEGCSEGCECVWKYWKFKWFFILKEFKDLWGNFEKKKIILKLNKKNFEFFDFFHEFLLVA